MKTTTPIPNSETLMTTRTPESEAQNCSVAPVARTRDRLGIRASSFFRHSLLALRHLAALIFWSVALAHPALCQLTPIQYNASDFTGTTNNLPVTLTSIQRLRINNQTMLVGLPISFTPVNGAYSTNIYPGLYNLAIQGVPAGVTCLVPAATNTQNLASCVISNMGLFSASNLNAIITNEVFILGGTNIQVTTNGFTFTINGIVTNLTGLTISNGTFYGTFTGNGSGLSGVQSTNSTLTWLGLYPTNGIAYAIQLNALSNALPTGNLMGTISSNNLGGLLPELQNTNGMGLTNITAARLLNPGVNSYSLIYTNFGGTDGIMLGLNQTEISSSGDYSWIVYAGTPIGSTYGGFFFPVGGTNYANGATVMGILSNGQTNYCYDFKALQVGGVPSTTQGNINGGTVGMFANPGWSFNVGTFYSGYEYDWIWQDPTNWITHFPSLPQTQNANLDPRNAVGYDTLTIDQHHYLVTVSNFAANGSNLFINNGFIGTTNTVTIGTTNVNTNERLLIQAPGTQFGPSANYAEVMIQSVSGNDGPSVRWSAHGGSDFNLVSTGSGDGTGANYFVLYSFGNSQYEWEIDPNGNMLVPAGALKVAKVMSAASITSTNSPTFSHTNTAPGNTTTPVLWIDVTNGVSVYRMPLYQ